jgi:signal transduction histidine kinase
MVRTCNTCEGFDPAELERLFDRFYRVEKSRSKQGGGFGVGLSIARSIAEAHRGSIKAECPRANTIQFTVFLRA